MNLKRHVTVSVLIFLLALTLPIYISSAQSTTIVVNPTDSYAKVGAAFSVNINITNVSNLAAWQFELYFDNSILNCTGVSEGSFLNSAGSTFFNQNVNNTFNSTNGQALAYCSMYGTNSANGTGVLATVYFQALSTGDSSLQLSDTKLYDSSMPPNPIDHTDIDGAVHVQNLLLTISTVGQGYVTLNASGPYYNYGDAVLLTAFPSVGWSFANWSGNLIGSANPATLVMTSNMSVTATFTMNAYTLSVFVFGGGSVSLNSTGPYQYGDVVLLTANPSTGWSFDHWSGNLTGSANPAMLAITGNMGANASFVQINYTVTTSVSPADTGYVSLNSNGPYHYGDSILLTAVPYVGWSFNYWSGDLVGTTNPATLVITGNMSVTAIFALSAYTLTISTVGQGYVRLNNTAQYYNYGDAILFTAVPFVGWSFANWSGNLIGSANPATLVIVGNMSVIATFTQNTYTISISVVGNGHVNLNNTGPCYYGDAVLLTAVPDAHWVFNYWSGNLVGSSSTGALIITGNMSVTAWFAQYVYTLTINVNGSGSVICNNTGPYYYGDVVQVTANASAGWSFQSWSGNLTGSANPTTILIGGNEIINVTFAPIQYYLTVNVVGNGSVTLNPNATYYYYFIQVQLTAVASTGWNFDHWSGDLVGSFNPCPITMVRNMSVTVTFVQTNYTLTVHVMSALAGTVTLNGTPPYYHYGDVALMIAVPNAGYSFEKWTGDLNSTYNPATLIMTGNMNVTAWFVQNVYTLTVNVVGTGKVTMNSTGPYNYANAILLTANSSTPWIFDHWTGGLTGSTNPATLVITANVSITAYFTIGMPTLFMSPTNVTCRVYDENFTVTVTLFDAVNVEDFAFEIDYNTTLLDYTNITWNAWGAGTVIVDESAGNITGSTSGNPLNGTQTLITIEFGAAYYHVWKSDPKWTNDLTAFIFFQWANLSYPSGPDLSYERGGLNQIYIGPEFTYTFSPIQGDVNNDGTVDIFDLRLVAAYYGAKEGDQNWTQATTYDLNGDGTIDTNDLGLVAANYGYTYTP